MDKSWIGTKKCTIKYIRGCEAFLDFAFAHNEGRRDINCPCKRCLNRFYYNRDRVREHILVDGFSPDYKIWTSHGEHYGESEHVNDNHEHFPVDNMFEMVHDIYGDHEVEGGCSSMGPDGDTEKMLKLIEDAERVLYPGCEKYTTLSFVIRFLQLKVRFGFSNTCFDEMMLLLKDAFPSGETLPASYYEAKKFKDSLGFKYVKYDACPNDCMLYWKDKAMETKCDICSEPRYKEIEYESYNGQKRKKQTPRKQVRYFPIKERLERLYMTSKSAKSMRWHAESLVEDAAKMHPAHYKAWKAFDERHPDFANDRRNVRLGLASYGFNPFNTITIPYSVWPVMLIPYNQEQGRCMKQTSMMLTLLIDRDRQPGNNIDVYLHPLIEDLKCMWIEGVRTYDADSDEMFQLRAALLWTINDFPAFANLSGWSTRGKFACPTCNSETDSRWLTYGRKHSYGGHRRFLPTNHPFRKDKRNFVGKAETRARPPVLSGEDLFRQVEGIENKFGKKAQASKKRPRSSKKKGSKPKHNWKKRSIFYELPYWKYNMLRHNLDVMHIEKNVCESIIFTLLGVDGRTKDNLNSRRDLKELRIRKSLHPIIQGKNGKEKKAQDERCDRIAMYFSTHTCSNGLPSDETAGIRMAEILQRLEAAPAERRDDVEFREHVYDEVFGPEKHGRVRCMGLGVTPTQVFGSSSSRRSSQNVDEVRKELEETRHAMEEQRKMFEARQAAQDLQLEEMRNFMTSLGKQLGQSFTFTASQTQSPSETQSPSDTQTPSQTQTPTGLSPPAAVHVAQTPPRQTEIIDNPPGPQVPPTTAQHFVGEKIVVYTWNNPPQTLAHGTIISIDPNKEVCGELVGEGHAEVRIDVCKNVLFPLYRYREDSFVTCIGAAKGKTVVWPLAKLESLDKLKSKKRARS